MAYLNTLSHLLQHFAWIGNWLFFLLAFIESAPFIGLFMPGATLISVGGFLASQGYLNSWDIVVYAALGAIIGDFSSYFLGRWGGDWIRSKRIINQKLLDSGEKFFHKHGNKSIFWGRFFGPIRAVIPFVAGLSKMKKQPFIFWNVISGILWSIFNVFLGYFSGSVFALVVKKWSTRLGTILIISIILTLIYWTVNKKESIKTYFSYRSTQFVKYLNSQEWFRRLAQRYILIDIFLKEEPRAAEKIFSVTLFAFFALFVYLLIIILDIF